MISYDSREERLHSEEGEGEEGGRRVEREKKNDGGLIVEYFISGLNKSKRPFSHVSFRTILVPFYMSDIL